MRLDVPTEEEFRAGLVDRAGNVDNQLVLAQKGEFTVPLEIQQRFPGLIDALRAAMVQTGEDPDKHIVGQGRQNEALDTEQHGWWSDMWDFSPESILPAAVGGALGAAFLPEYLPEGLADAFGGVLPEKIGKYSGEIIGGAAGALGGALLSNAMSPELPDVAPINGRSQVAVNPSNVTVPLPSPAAANGKVDAPFIPTESGVDYMNQVKDRNTGEARWQSVNPFSRSLAQSGNNSRRASFGGGILV